MMFFDLFLKEKTLIDLELILIDLDLGKCFVLENV
jgi:hypothetical protein